MRFPLLLALCIPVHAAVIRGVVVEDAGGLPLARSLVVVQPIAGTSAPPQSMRSDHDGQFEFGSLPPGAYLVLASRRGFAPVQYGQKQWKGSGVPLVLGDSGSTSLEIRLQRFGSIAGTVLDENDVGLPDHEVVAYKNERPPLLVARATTDDRGVYRFLGLEPGSYLVRTVGKEYDEGSYVPTFSLQTTRTNEAYTAEVQLDRETAHVDIRPFPGRLFTVAGRAVVSQPGAVTVTLVSDVGIQSVSTDARGNFEFPPAAPGPYELYATSKGTAGYQAITVDRDRSDYRLTLAALPELHLSLRDQAGQPIDDSAAQILIRHRDLATVGTPQTLHAPAAMAPGRWELLVAPTQGYYAASFSGARGARADGWNEVELAAGVNSEFSFVLSPHPASLHGTVQQGDQPVAGVPVYLDADGLETRMTRTDTAGRYEFYGLAPGPYRLLASFEAIGTSQGRGIDVQEGQDQALDLILYKAQ
jgi:protocatechuate 3,4-dioxygenase beta subunit